MFEDKVLERDDFARDDDVSPRFVPASRREVAPQESPAARQPASPAKLVETQPWEPGRQRGNSLLRRPAVLAIGAVLLAATLGGGYVYLDYAKHFQSTDDAFIAARQTALAPKVSGYLTAVPVTDNEHVATGDVIARIDDRDYRIALEQAEAQVAAAQAGIENIDAQLNVQQAQISTNEAQVDQAQAALVFAHRVWHRSERPAVDLPAAPAGGRASQCASDP
jgi:membrane fusion protein (multidrug efflux system)